MPEGFRRFVSRDDRLGVPEQLCAESVELLGGPALARGAIVRSVEVPPRSERGESLRHPEFFGQADALVGEACPVS
eukprot:3536593-Pyramimonas_sp.AAC.1